MRGQIEGDSPDEGAETLDGTQPREDRQFVTALARGLEILRCFTPASPELGTTEIARMTKLPQSTVWRLCHTMVKLGFLRISDSGEALRLGIPVLSLGYAVLASNEISALALPYMQAIAEQYHGAVSLGARDGLTMIYLQRCQGSFIILPHLRVGSRVPLASSGTGWAYLAGLDPDARQKLQRQLRKSPAADWDANEAPFLEALKGYEDKGYIVNKGLLHREINSVAVPVKSLDDSSMLTLSSGGINAMFDDAKLAAIGEELKKLATEIAPILAGRGGKIEGQI